MDMNKEMSTDNLFKKMCSDTLEDIFKLELSSSPFHEYISRMCEERSEKREHVIKRSGLNRTYGHQIFNGTRKPSRDKIIQLAIGFGLDIEQTQQLLKAAQESPLSPRIKRDAAMIYGIMHQLDITDMQKLLADFKLLSLGG